MRVKSPIGEYDYRVTGLRAGSGGLEVDGSLGQWETTMVVEPQDMARLARPIAPALLLAVLLLRRRRRSRR